MAEDHTDPHHGQSTQASEPVAAKRSRVRKSKTNNGMTAEAGAAQPEVNPSETHQPEANMPEVELTLADNLHTPPPAEPSPVYTPAVSFHGCGLALKSAREAQGLSIQEVCRQLRLSTNQIQAIEQDAFDQLPQKTIVRGFIRNYARLLNIDAAPILQAYQTMVPLEAPLALTVKSNADESVFEAKASSYARPSQLLKYLLWGLLLAILAYFYYHHIRPNTAKNDAVVLNAPATTASLEAGAQNPAAVDTLNTAQTPPATLETGATASSETAAATGTEATPVTTSQATPPSASPSAPVTLPAISSTPAPAVAPTPASSATTPVVTTQAAGASATDAARTSSSQTVVSTPTPADGRTVSEQRLNAVESGKTTLKFKVNDESWIRVEDADGKKILSQILPAGGEQLLTANKPLTLIVGNASATQLFIDNQPYDLTLATRGRVARVQLK